MDPGTAAVVSAGIGALGSIFGGRRSSASKMSKKTAKWLYNLANEMLAETQAAKKAGVFDPDKIMREMRNLAYDQMQGATNRAAGALRIAGYRPGDTPMDNTLSGIAASYAKEIGNKASAIRQNSLMNLLQAYNSSGATIQGNVANIYQNLAKMEQERSDKMWGGVANLLNSALSYDALLKQSKAAKQAPQQPVSAPTPIFPPGYDRLLPYYQPRDTRPFELKGRLA